MGDYTINSKDTSIEIPIPGSYLLLFGTMLSSWWLKTYGGGVLNNKNLLTFGKELSAVYYEIGKALLNVRVNPATTFNVLPPSKTTFKSVLFWERFRDYFNGTAGIIDSLVKRVEELEKQEE